GPGGHRVDLRLAHRLRVRRPLPAGRGPNPGRHRPEGCLARGHTLRAPHGGHLDGSRRTGLLAHHHRVEHHDLHRAVARLVTMSALPLLPATVIGSWAFPGWYAKFCEDVVRHPELFGPDDREEALLDAVRLAVDDQLRAGADLITDGEMHRVDFNLGFYDYLTGLEPLPPRRRWGAPAHDQRSRYRCTAPLLAPHGLGTV